MFTLSVRDVNVPLQVIGYVVLSPLNGLGTRYANPPRNAFFVASAFGIVVSQRFSAALNVVVAAIAVAENVTRESGKLSVARVAIVTFCPVMLMTRSPLGRA